MKKVILIIAMMLTWLVSYAQMNEVRVFNEFKLGDYTLKCWLPEQEMGGGRFCYTCKTPQEARTLCQYIRYNRAALEEKFSVTIEYVTTSGLPKLTVTAFIYDTDTYNKYKEAQEEKKAKELNDRLVREDSLNRVLE